MTCTIFIIVLLLTAAAAAPAQTNEDARALLEETAAASRAARSWLVEGVQVSDLSGRGMHMHDESRFKAAYQAPSKMLSQTSSNSTVAGVNAVYPSGTLRVCDGTDHWVYNSPSHSFYRSHEAAGGCKPDFGDFSKITENLVSAASIGRDHVEFAGEGAQRECELVRAEYSEAVPGAGPAAPPSVHTLCIDRAQKLVLRDRAERGNSSGMLYVETTTYSRYERNTALSADLFQFQVPTGYFVDDGPQPGLIVENGV